MAINYTTLFTRLGKGFAAQEAINTARGTTIPPKIKAYGDEFDSASLEFKAAISQLDQANSSQKASGSGAMNILRSSMRDVLIETMDAENPLAAKSEREALEALVADMAAESESVDASAVGSSVAADAGNNGDGAVVVSVKRADGRNQELLLAEDLRLKVTGDTTPATASIQVRGEASVADRLSADWPKGSGVSRTLTAISAASTLLGNGNFDSEEDVANAPDDWIASVATVGTTLKLTDYEVQTITVTGSPTTGTWRITYTNADGEAQTTEPLDYNATAASVQAALQALVGLESVTVTSTGTDPNYTHTITLTGVAGDVTQLSTTEDTDSGTYTAGTTSAGSANAYAGKAVELDSDGAELTTLNRAVTLQPLTQYAFNAYLLADVVPAAGVLTVDLVDGIGGTVLQDEQGTSNSFTIDATALTTSFAARNGVFRTPRVLPPSVYLRIRISTAVSSGTSIFIDHAALAAMTELYAGGPAVAVFSGNAPFRKGVGQVAGDGWTLTLTNDRAGEFQEWFDRNFDLRGKGLLLPSNAAGSETIDDALIA